MRLSITNGWLDETQTVKRLPSPNFDCRPDGEAVNLLVIHHISLPPNQFGGKDIESFFTNQLDTESHPFYQQIKNIQVSAHILIKRNGEIVQFVSFNDRAWHAGKSNYQGRSACNDFSIGIELEGDKISPYRYAQYKMLGQLTLAIQAAYPFIGSHITGHEDISPGRKTDPGPLFDWQKYQELLVKAR